MRRTGVRGGTQHANSEGWFLVIGSLAPGGNCEGVPVFADKHGATSPAQDYFFGRKEGDYDQQVEIYDPFYICCAFGPEEIDTEKGWETGDIIRARFNQYTRRYEVASSFGLVRKARLTEDLTAGGDAKGNIESANRDGTDGGGIANVDIYHWNDSGSDTIPNGTPIKVWFESSSRRWYTDAYKAPP